MGMRRAGERRALCSLMHVCRASFCTVSWWMVVSNWVIYSLILTMDDCDTETISFMATASDVDGTRRCPRRSGQGDIGISGMVTCIVADLENARALTNLRLFQFSTFVPAIIRFPALTIV